MSFIHSQCHPRLSNIYKKGPTTAGGSKPGRAAAVVGKQAPKASVGGVQASFSVFMPQTTLTYCCWVQLSNVSRPEKTVQQQVRSPVGRKPVPKDYVSATRTKETTTNKEPVSSSRLSSKRDAETTEVKRGNQKVLFIAKRETYTHSGFTIQESNVLRLADGSKGSVTSKDSNVCSPL